jgi:alcohol dehydrogenase (cytochrome c)
MRRVLVLVFAAVLVPAAVVGLASADVLKQSTGAKRAESALASAKARANAISSYLPAGVTPAGKNWISGEGDESNSRFSTLSQVNSSNVQNLHVVWNAQFNDPTIQFTPEGQPICCPNNMMYLAYQTGVVAVDPATGNTLWNYVGPYTPPIAGQRVHVDEPRDTSYSAKLNYIFAGQQDGSIVALNAKTGAPVWTVQVTGAGGYGAVTGAESAPFTQYYDDGGDGIVLSAPNGGESPFRGHLDAYDAKTGKLVWRTWTLPDPSQVPYILTWGNPAEAATGGAADWSIPAVDPQLGTVVFGTGNPFPETGRAPGSDLWTESIMAVDW